MDKVEKIKSEIKRRKSLEDKEKDNIYFFARSDAYAELLNFIDSLEEEPDCIYNHTPSNPQIHIGTKIRSKTNPDVILSIVSDDCHGDEFECSNGSVLSLKQIEKYYDIYIEEKMESKFKMGDVFTKKYTRDTIPIEIYEISYNAIEPIYKLKPIRLCGDDVILGEEALIKLYNKIN